MTRDTIDVGIDLGTTNSALALASGADATVVRNTWQREFTPSAVYLSGSGNVYVGEEARSRIERDPDNACAEFKLQMGTPGEHKVFEASGRRMTPEELSAEVLKSLRADLQRTTGEEAAAAVVTVPAAFSLDQCDATRRAAALAGFDYAPLVQEPTAAAWAYASTAEDRKAFWMVYDFGGGTFDAAVVNVRDGEFGVVNHAGDNFLGGKLIDWALVEDLLAPAVAKEHGLADLTRGNRRWAGNIAKLKHAAESAKIALSASPVAEVRVELADADGRPFEFVREVTREELAAFTDPLYTRSVNLCRRALSEKGLAPGDIERLILVGGATLSPGLRERLADAGGGLGIPLDFSMDAITVVARGAAMFAGTQRMPQSHRGGRAGATKAVDAVSLDLEHKSVGSDDEPLVGGRATGQAPGSDWSGCTVEFANDAARPPWRSGRIELAADGAFVTRLRAQTKSTNEFRIDLRDPRGSALPTDPEKLTYRHTPLVGGAAVLTHSVGVGLADKAVRWLLEKGTELPARCRVVLTTTTMARSGSGEGLIRVPLVEGERPKADRNTLIGRLEINSRQMVRDVPAGSEVEISVEIDASRTVRAEAYVPILDQDFEIEVELGRAEIPAPAGLRDHLSAVSDRAHEVRRAVAELPVPEATRTLDRLHAEAILEEAGRLLRAAEVDPVAGANCHARLLDAETLLDDVEDALQLPSLMERVRKLREVVARKVEAGGTEEDRDDLAAADAVAAQALANRDRAVLRRQADVLMEIGARLLRRSGKMEAIVFEDLRRILAKSKNDEVKRLIARGRTALSHRDPAELAVVNAELRKRLPRGRPGTGAQAAFSTVDEG
ncbi:MAG: Hsp70 family protein [Sporichthyaceae bacterium]